MASEDSTTWGEVCEKVGFQDGLYRTCREKIEGFDGLQNGSFDEGAPEPDMGKQIMSSALAIPEVPEGGWPKEEQQQPPQGFLGGMPVGKVLMYGGIAAVVAFLLLQKKREEIVATETVPAAPKGVTSQKAA
jgi:hypothetical protein